MRTNFYQQPFKAQLCSTTNTPQQVLNNLYHTIKGFSLLITLLLLPFANSVAQNCPIPCSITGSISVCPASTNTYVAPAGMNSYSWSVTNGTASVSDADNLETVAVLAPINCTSYTLSLTINQNGCISTCTKICTATDTEKPIFSFCPPNVDLGCNPTVFAVPNQNIAATDNCGSPVITYNIGGVTSIGCGVQRKSGARSGPVCCIKTQVITYTATDACGNTSSCLQEFTWKEDFEKPEIVIEDVPDLDCNPSQALIEATFGAATVNDNCSLNLIAIGTIEPEIAGAGCERSVTKTWTVTDECGNTQTASQTITFTRDIIAPIITATGAALTLGCSPTAAQIEAALGTATASDNCGLSSPLAVNTGLVTTIGCSKSQTRTWTVTDDCGNLGSASRTATWTIDTQKPVITASGTTVFLSCNPSAAAINAALGTATASDNCGVGTPIVTTGPVNGTGCAKTQTRTWNVTDNCGNAATQVGRTVSWTVDTQVPVITATGSTLTLGCNPSTTQIEAALGTASATDNCGVGTPIATTGLVTGLGCNKTQTRTWNVTDNCGKVAVAVSRVVSWISDTTKPIFTYCPPTVDLGCNPVNLPVADPNVTATDNCSAVSISTTFSPIASEGCGLNRKVKGRASTSCCIKTQIITYTATDGCGNISTCEQTFTWKIDNEKPEITLADYPDLPCNPSSAEIEAAFGTATVTDNCSEGLVAVGVILEEVAVSDCEHSVTKVWTVTDECGNKDSLSQTITFSRDVTPPVIIAIGSPLTLNCNPTAAQIEAALGTATVTDNCGLYQSVDKIAHKKLNRNVASAAGAISIGTDGPITETGCLRSQTRTWSETDYCGNIGTATRTATWTVDTAKPVITAVGTTLTLGCNPSPTQILDALGTATASDNCGVGAPVFTQATTITNCTFTRTRTWNVTDNCGNAALPVSRAVSWTRDSMPPVITTAGSTLVLGCNPSAAQIEAALGTATATDYCGITADPSATTGVVNGTGCTKSQTRSWTVIDNCGNIGTASRTITWTADTGKPVLGTLPTPSTIVCTGMLQFTTPTVTDNCGSGAVLSFKDTITQGSCTSTITTKRTWIATDACGNVSLPVSQVITRNCPCAEQCFESAANPTKAAVGATQTWTTNPDSTITIRTTLAKTYVDNTYGANKIGWSSTHVFTDLTLLDMLQLALYDRNGTKKIEFKMDYLTASNTVSSGYKSLGVTGGDGAMVLGYATDIVSVTTSMDRNFNANPSTYWLTTNSPATTTAYAVNATYPNWIYDVWYEVKVKASVFGTAGYGNSAITGINVSPSKVGTTTETFRACGSVCNCTIAYPDNTNLPKSAVVFNESEVLRLSDPGPLNCGQTDGVIRLWYNDEHAMTLGVRSVVIKTSAGTTTTNYPFTPTPASPTCVVNPIVGTTIATGDQSGNDVAAGGGRPLWPAVFITDLTVQGLSSRAGDWQQGGIGYPPHKVCGTWKGAVKTIDKTKNPATITVTPDANPAKNNWNIAGGDTPLGGFSVLKNEGYGAECAWNISQLGLIPGHKYRIQFMVHDGDQNKVGGDCGETCTTIDIPGSTQSKLANNFTAALDQPVVIERTFNGQETKLNVFPNPASGNVNITFTPVVSGMSTITIVDVRGTTVLKVDIGKTTAGKEYRRNINIQRLLKGEYNVQLISEGEVTTQKLVVN